MCEFGESAVWIAQQQAKYEADCSDVDDCGVISHRDNVEFEYYSAITRIPGFRVYCISHGDAAWPPVLVPPGWYRFLF